MNLPLYKLAILAVALFAFALPFAVWDAIVDGWRYLTGREEA